LEKEGEEEKEGGGRTQRAGRRWILSPEVEEKL
jgi:hypothetical protein